MAERGPGNSFLLPTPAMTQASQAPSSTPRERVRPIEYLLVAVIATVVGAMAVPDFTPEVPGMEGFAKEARLQFELRNFREALEEYREEHKVYPGYGPGRANSYVHGEPAGVHFKRQMLMWSDEWGHAGPLSPGSKELGPYLETGLPKNPLNGLRDVRLVPDGVPFPTEPDGRTGWLFKPETGELRANVAGGSPLTGQSYYEL